LLESIGFNPENNNPYPPESHIASFVSPVSVRTSFSQVVDFLGRLTANRRLINIREISLQMEKDKNQDIPTNFNKFSYTNQYLFWNQENEKK